MGSFPARPAEATVCSLVESRPWEIPGAENEPILGALHLPPEGVAPRAVCLIVHGFLGYKDYGLFPHLAAACAAAGCVAHRFNLSHSGMTNAIETFERPDLFEQDTWGKQVLDVEAVIDAVGKGEIDGAGLPLALIGHSRGGVTVLLAAGQRFEHGREPLPSAIVTLSAPDRCCLWSDEKKSEHLERGYTEVRSNRTGQTLRVGRAWLQEQLDAPKAHDVKRHAGLIACPMLFVHGADDPTVPPTSARSLEEASNGRGKAMLVEGADHVFNTPNPFPAEAEPSPQLGAVERAVTGLIADIT